MLPSLLNSSNILTRKVYCYLCQIQKRQWGKGIRNINGILFIERMWHYVGGPLSRRSLCLFWRETKQRAWARDLRRDRKWVRERESGVGRRNAQKSVCDGDGSRHRAAEETSRHEIGSSSSEGRPIKMSQHPSWFVEISLEIHASVSLQGIQCHNLTLLHLSWPKPNCSFVLCFFFSHSLDCISCSHEEMCNTPIGTTRWFTG